MIHGISGKPGGGKSYEAVVSHIIPVITKDKRLVVTNLPLDIEHFCAVYGEFCRDLIILVDGNFTDYGGLRPFSEASHYLRHSAWENEKGQKAYFFIDECHLALPKGRTVKETTEFFSMHRHYGFDIVLITQNFRKVDVDIKDMIVNHYRAIKKSMMGQDDRYILKVHDGATSTNASVVATHERIYEKKYFPFYQSHTMSKSSVDEATSNDIEKWYKHWTIKLSFVFFVVAIFIIYSNLSGASDDVISDSEVLPVNSSKSTGVSVVAPVVDSEVSSPVVEQKTVNQLQYEAIVSKSSSYHPFYKMDLSVSGSASYTDNGFQVKVVYFSASQNGQHVFTMTQIDLLKAGYDVQILGDCAVGITYFSYTDYLTCSAPTVSVSLGGSELAAN